MIVNGRIQTRDLFQTLSSGSDIYSDPPADLSSEGLRLMAIWLSSVEQTAHEARQKMEMDVFNHGKKDADVREAVTQLFLIYSWILDTFPYKDHGRYENFGERIKSVIGNEMKEIKARDYMNADHAIFKARPWMREHYGL